MPKADALQTAMQQQFQTGDLLQSAADHARSYVAGSRERRVAPSAEAIAALSKLREPVPETIGDPQAILDLLAEVGGAASLGQLGGRFFGLVNGSAVPVGMAARMLADAWDQNAAFHKISPISATLEEVCQDWLNDLLGLPSETVAGFVSGSTMAIVCGLAAARWRLCERAGWDVNRDGLNGAPKIRLVGGRHIHSSVMKGIALLGFGTATVEWAEVDDQGRLRVETLPELDEKTILLLQAGNVNSGSFDPIREACEVAAKAGSWVHVDGAFGLWAAAVPELRHLTDGLHLAHSWSVDGHKTLNTPYDSGISLCRDGEAMVKALQNSAPYYTLSEQRDGAMYTPELSRRARATDLWAVLKYLGREGVARMVLTLHERSVLMARKLTDAGFEVLNEVVFNQTMIRVGDQSKTDTFVEAIQSSGEAWIGASLWFGEPVVRVSICSWATTEADLDRAVSAFKTARG